MADPYSGVPGVHADYIDPPLDGHAANSGDRRESDYAVSEDA